VRCRCMYRAAVSVLAGTCGGSDEERWEEEDVKFKNVSNWRTRSCCIFVLFVLLVRRLQILRRMLYRAGRRSEQGSTETPRSAGEIRDHHWRPYSASYSTLLECSTSYTIQYTKPALYLLANIEMMVYGYFRLRLPFAWSFKEIP
jgi:hypothetical protein